MLIKISLPHQFQAEVQLKFLVHFQAAVPFKLTQPFLPLVNGQTIQKVRFLTPECFLLLLTFQPRFTMGEDLSLIKFRAPLLSIQLTWAYATY